MKRIPPAVTLVFIILAVFLVISLSAAGSLAQSDEPHLVLEAPDFAQEFSPAEAAPPKALSDLKLDALPESVQRPYPIGKMTPFNTNELDAGNCGQLIVNPKMNVIDFGDGTGSIEPWIIFSQIVYFSKQIYHSPQYSLAMADGDEGSGGNPDVDYLGQNFLLPTNLNKIRVEFSTASVNRDAADHLYVFLSTLDRDGGVIETIRSFEIPQPVSEEAWETWFFEIDMKNELRNLDGKFLGLDFMFEGDRQSPFEFAFLDDATVTACVSGSRTYLPSVVNKFGKSSAPICTPPNETPQDSIGANRGYVDTGALCKSNLSKTDTQDYYTFNIKKSGKHTLHLTNLPSGTEWSAAVILNQNPPKYAPGPTGGHCRIGTPGSGNKNVTCMLDQNKDYIVKVSAGTYNGPLGNYRMRVTGP